VTGLTAGTSYIFRVRAQNLVGVGKPSAELGPILAQTRPDPELSLTVSLWRIWAPSPVWSQILTASPPATLSLRRKYTMKFDKSTGLIELFMDSLELTDEGTFTFNLVDGKAKGTTSLVLIGDASERVKSGVTGEQLWLKINEPTEKDKGKYTMDIFDGKDGVKRVLDLTGKDRARVVGGLPDVVAIQEGKSLNLTGNVWGEPTPEVCWVKNDKELVSDNHYTLKFEHGKFASITIAAVTTVDSGKYALIVKNKYGKEAGEFTVSVYNPDEESKEEKKD
ncbi:hypothetical protein GOODEAATRI_008962, partial [Goodea atripinnis]